MSVGCFALCMNYCGVFYVLCIQVQVSCGKVLSLSVQEPLMKILAGLEYILRKSQVRLILLCSISLHMCFCM